MMTIKPDEFTNVIRTKFDSDVCEQIHEDDREKEVVNEWLPKSCIKSTQCNPKRVQK